LDCVANSADGSGEVGESLGGMESGQKGAKEVFCLLRILEPSGNQECAEYPRKAEALLENQDRLRPECQGALQTRCRGWWEASRPFLGGHAQSCGSPAPRSTPHASQGIRAFPERISF